MAPFLVILTPASSSPRLCTLGRRPAVGETIGSASEKNKGRKEQDGAA